MLYRAQQGQAMVETIVIMIATLLLLLGGIQIGLIFNAKNTLNYATFEAARAGALNHADKRSIEYAFARGMSPLYSYASSADSMLDKVSNVKRSRNRVLDEAKSEEFVCIKRLNPTSAAFNSHGVNDELGRFNRVIPNDNLLYRTNKDAGSGVSIQDANLLKLEITYCYPMYVPMISTLIRRLMGTIPDPDPLDGWTAPTLGGFRNNCLVNNRFPLTSQGIVRMQTPAKNDVFPTSCD